MVQGLDCTGSHGISVGSLGQYPGEYDIVEDIYVYNISMTSASDGARIKVWPGTQSALSGDLQGGGGRGHVKNVTYDTFGNHKNDYAIQVTQCYGQKNKTLCELYPVRSPSLPTTVQETNHSNRANLPSRTSISRTSTEPHHRNMILPLVL